MEFFARKKIKFSVATLMLTFIIFAVFQRHEEIKKTVILPLIECGQSYMPCEVGDETKDLSKKLNEAMRKVSMLNCDLQDMKSINKMVSSTGGYCGKISGKNSSDHFTDPTLVIWLSEFWKGKKVASFGDGPGIYKTKILALNQLVLYDAFDGAPFAELTTNGDVVHLDLSVPIYHLPLYDWILSLEVAEHIPVEYEQIFIDNLTRHAKEGIILSWATLGQGGREHVNNRNISYVAQQMEKRGFNLDMSVSNSLKDASTFGHLKRNTYVYFRTLKL